MVAYEYLGNELSINQTQTIGATSTEISIMKRRLAYSIRNTSTAGQVISIVLSNTQDAVDGVGIILNANESFIDSNSEGYKCWNGSIRAISSAVGGTIAIMERV